MEKKSNSEYKDKMNINAVEEINDIYEKSWIKSELKGWPTFSSVAY